MTEYRWPVAARVATLLLAAVAAWVLVVRHYDTVSPTHDPLAVEEKPLPDFSAFRDAREKKQAFFDYLLPIVEAQNAQLRTERAEIEQMIVALQQRDELDKARRHRLVELVQAYQIDAALAPAEQLAQLRKRVDIVPISLALSQAASESGWGTSRFAREANNLFGEWCFREGCGVVPERRRSSARHEVARFDSTRAAIASYMHNLNTHAAYQDFRVRRQQLRDQQQPLTGIALVDDLERYSERGNHYVRELRTMILSNKLQRFDLPARLDPSLVAEGGDG